MDKAQQGVVRGMALALITAITAYVIAATYGPKMWAVEVDLEARTTIAAWSILGPSAMLFVCIARLANHRFFTPEDIDGSALTAGTERARLLQALLQNTLEQACLAVPVYIATSVIAPGFLLALVPTAAVMFLVGRVAFFTGYINGAPGRAFGFALTFYPTLLLIVMLIVLGIARIAGR